MREKGLRYALYLLTFFETILFIVAGAILGCGRSWWTYVIFAVLSLLAGWCDETRKHLWKMRWEEEGKKVKEER